LVAAINLLSGRRSRRSRRVVAAALAGLTVLSLSSVLRGPAEASGSVIVASRAIAAGAVITAADLSPQAWPARLASTGLVTSNTQAVGERAAVPIDAGAPLTTNALVGPSLIDDPALVLVAVRLFDAGSVELVSAGDRIDLLAVPSITGESSPSSAIVVAANARVVTTPARGGDGGSSFLSSDSATGSGASGSSASSSGALLLALDRATSARVAAAAATSRMSIVVRPH